MQPKAITLSIVALLDLLIFLDLVTGLAYVQSVWLWFVIHVSLVLFASALLGRHLLGTVASDRRAQQEHATEHELEDGDRPGSRQYYLVALIALFGVLVPGVGITGISLALLYGLHTARSRSYVPEYWQVTRLAGLPYVAPMGRSITPLDSRGFSEHLLYSTDDRDIYHKVLASANVRTSLAIGTLKQAMQHSDERVRLTAYKTLDKKVTALNKQIQSLEKSAAEDEQGKTADIWLQIASNYWELITLEGGEAVARKQLLANAAKAAIRAVALEPENRNAHLVVGRVFLAQGEVRRASVALARSNALGMPADKVIPYLAECAYVNRDFPRVHNLLARLDPAIVAYPPLSHVAQYWA